MSGHYTVGHYTVELLWHVLVMFDADMVGRSAFHEIADVSKDICDVLDGSVEADLRTYTWGLRRGEVVESERLVGQAWHRLGEFFFEIDLDLKLFVGLVGLT